ncbi:MAG: winged helix-turn-helix transcriptional regulator [Spirochaetes bacterium]|nr:winged helix-turn-helix transcriptional regulator [Spirochaetota bacterium]
MIQLLKRIFQVDYEKDSDILKALGHPIRLRMVCGLLVNNDCNVNKMVDELELPQSTVSQHLGILRNKGIIKPVKDGVRTCYQVIDKRVIKIVKLLSE